VRDWDFQFDQGQIDGLVLIVFLPSTPLRIKGWMQNGAHNEIAFARQFDAQTYLVGDTLGNVSGSEQPGRSDERCPTISTKETGERWPPRFIDQTVSIRTIMTDNHWLTHLSRRVWFFPLTA
jgi:hypothetical protein